MKNFVNFAEYNRNLHYATCFYCRLNLGCVTIKQPKHGSDLNKSINVCKGCAPILHSFGPTSVKGVEQHD